MVSFTPEGGPRSPALVRTASRPLRLLPRKTNYDCQVKSNLTHIIHLIRNSLAFVSWKDRKLIIPDLKAIYRAETAEMAGAELEVFEVQWGKRYPAIGQAWRRAWEYVVPLFAFPPAIRKVIYTTNAVESLHRSLRKIIKTRGSFPTDEAALKLLFLAIHNWHQMAQTG